MSIKQESQPSTPQPNKEFGKEWRKTPWQDKGSLEKNLRKFNVSHSDVKYIRLLVVGEVGAGKSSFINSVNNVFQGRITSGALVDATSGKSFTKAYKTHYIYREDGSCLPFVFNDIMGLEGPDGCGAPVEDIISALAGLVEEGYKFNPVSAKTTSTPNCTPSLGAQTYCLVNIIAADKVSRMDDKVIKKMKNIREKASEMDMPQVIIMTRVDEACPLVKDDIRKIYNSKKIKEKDRRVFTARYGFCLSAEYCVNPGQCQESAHLVEH
ncbi:interferon-induced protein 44-like isoform X2 [Brachyhypopomus gauderio]|uniref:interferon-induced protein 44-like isoform X2 n=1 Tax=Brachyhypopomus gauderio TaxID=698409 RepID=UPI004043444B